jgi:iron complex outermembrane receptor protein
MISSVGASRWLCLGLLACPLIATAQRVTENPVTAANDAFGTTVGSQTIGLYDAEDVRGFSPRDAGNLRLEGLYFDQQTDGIDSCLVSEQSIKVGLAAQSFDFPAPTGIANFSLSVPEAGAVTSVVLSRGPFDGAALELDGQYGREDQPVSVSLCFHRYVNSDFDFAKRTQSNETGLVVHDKLSGDLELIAFGGTSDGNEHNLLPFVYTDGVEGVPTFRQMRLPTQDWSGLAWRDLTAGAIVRTTSTGPWSFAAGIFHSAATNPKSYEDLFLDVTPDRTAIHQFDVVSPLDASSTSGEIRLSYRTSGATRAQQWALTVRGRSVSRTFGGDSITTDPVRVSIDDFTPVAQPLANLTAGSVDRVHQYGLGVSFDQVWTGRGSVGVGVQKVNYQRFIDAPGDATATDESDPVLPTVRFTVIPGSDFLLYGSYTRGLEDSALAPANATNRGESPPATTTWQLDAGLRYTPRPNMQFLFGAFEVNKAYFNLDSTDFYTQLGQIRHRGLEASATIKGGRGLVAVLGGVWLQADVQAADATVSSPAYTPLGTVPLLLNADIDYAPPSWKPWALSCGWTGNSERPATNNDSIRLPAYSQLSFTVRYEFRVFGHPGIARFEAQDVGDSDAMNIDSSGLVVSERGRSFALILTADF